MSRESIENLPEIDEDQRDSCIRQLERLIEAVKAGTVLAVDLQWLRVCDQAECHEHAHVNVTSYDIDATHPIYSDMLYARHLGMISVAQAMLQSSLCEREKGRAMNRMVQGFVDQAAAEAQKESGGLN
jgi:hypothetical protein